MIQRIVLTNFMAHEHSVIELGPGLTVLTGPNNTGKSAVVEALRCVAENTAPRQHIRHGAKEARVEVHLEEGWRVVWVRRKNYPLYEVWAPGADEPVVHAKIGRKVPDEVQQLLRMPLVELDEGAVGKDNKVDVHLGNQRYPIFLLDRPGSALAQFFAASTEGAHLLEMQDLLKKRAAEAKNSLKSSTRRLERLEQELDRLAPLPELELRSQEAEAQLERIHALQQQLPSLQQLLQGMDRSRRLRATLLADLNVLKQLTPAKPLQSVEELVRLLQRHGEQRAAKNRTDKRLQTLTPLAEPPQLYPTPALAALLQQVWQYLAFRDRLQRRQRELQPLAAPAALFPTAPLARHLLKRRQLDNQTQEVNALGQALAPLAVPPVLQPVAELAAVIQRQQALRSRLQQQRKAAQTAAQTASPPELQQLAPLQQTMARLRELRQQRQTLAEETARREQSLQDFQQRLDSRLKELGACPLCGGLLDMERFLKKGHVHG